MRFVYPGQQRQTNTCIQLKSIKFFLFVTKHIFPFYVSICKYYFTISGEKKQNEYRRFIFITRCGVSHWSFSKYFEIYNPHITLVVLIPTQFHRFYKVESKPGKLAAGVPHFLRYRVTVHYNNIIVSF